MGQKRLRTNGQERSPHLPRQEAKCQVSPAANCRY